MDGLPLGTPAHFGAWKGAIFSESYCRTWFIELEVLRGAREIFQPRESLVHGKCHCIPTQVGDTSLGVWVPQEHIAPEQDRRRNREIGVGVSKAHPQLR